MFSFRRQQPQPSQRLEISINVDDLGRIATTDRGAHVFGKIVGSILSQAEPDMAPGEVLDAISRTLPEGTSLRDHFLQGVVIGTQTNTGPKHE